MNGNIMHFTFRMVHAAQLVSVSQFSLTFNIVRIVSGERGRGKFLTYLIVYNTVLLIRVMADAYFIFIWK